MLLPNLLLFFFYIRPDSVPSRVRGNYSKFCVGIFGKKSLSDGCEAVGVSSFRWRNVELIIVSIRELNFPNETHDRKINSYLRSKDSPIKLLNARHFLAQSGFVPPSPPLCMEALGMQSGRIKPDALQASSQYDANHGADNGRLHFQKTGSRIGAWSAKTADGNQYIQAKFDVVAKVRRVATQGRMDADQWVKTYTLAYSFDGKTWKDYKLNNIVTVRSQIFAVVDVFGICRLRCDESHRTLCYGFLSLILSKKDMRAW